MSIGKQGFKVSILFLFLFLLFSQTLFAEEDAQVYSRAREAAQSGHMDFAFMYYRSILNDYPDSKFKAQALFAQGEYYFLLPNYHESASLFNKFISLNPDPKEKLFALAYLLKIAQIQGNESLEKDLQKTILTLNPMDLVFRDFKEYNYRSPLDRKHKAVFRIDKIQFYVQGEMFVQISL